jgi:3-deoxy-D-manno-octulosonate 8-phosphate phosphatase (KDO 8-P phosphatase)
MARAASEAMSLASTNKMNSEFRKKARQIQMLLLDVDGVLTDGTFEPNGTEEIKRFHSRDGIGLTLAKRAGLKLGLISGRVSSVVSERARELEMHFVRLGVDDKLTAFREVLEQEGLTPKEIAYMGDDLPDLPILTRVGLAAAVSDAHNEVRTRVDYVTRARGGFGAVRELIDQILLAKGLQEKLVQDFLR